MEELNLDHHSPCFKYEERVCVKSLLDRKQESESSRRADSDHNEAAHQKMMSESWELNGERLWLTGQLELLLLDDGPLVWEVLCNHVLQVCWTARFWLRRGQHICNRLLFPLVSKRSHVRQYFSNNALPLWSLRTPAGVVPLTFLFFLGCVDFSSSFSFFGATTHSVCEHSHRQETQFQYRRYIWCMLN